MTVDHNTMRCWPMGHSRRYFASGATVLSAPLSEDVRVTAAAGVGDG